MRTSLVAKLLKNLPAMQETLVWLLGWDDPWRRDRLPTPVFLGFPGDQTVKNAPAIQEPGFDLWVGKIPWRRSWQLTWVFLPGEFHGQRRLACYSLWGEKSWTLQSNTAQYRKCESYLFSGYEDSRENFAFIYCLNSFVLITILYQAYNLQTVFWLKIWNVK